MSGTDMNYLATGILGAGIAIGFGIIVAGLAIGSGLGAIGVGVAALASAVDKLGDVASNTRNWIPQAMAGLVKRP
jgi:ethanolamine transporter EutH